MKTRRGAAWVVAGAAWADAVANGAARSEIAAIAMTDVRRIFWRAPDLAPDLL
jgi:hypothetical protein